MNSTAILADREGCVVDSRFSLVRWLGGTAEGSVYLTATTGAGAGKAAIKLIPAGNPGAETRLAGWAAAARIAHPHLLHVLYTGHSTLKAGPQSGLDGGSGGQVLYAVTECAEEVLGEILPDRPLTPDETKEMLAPILEALACLHGRGYMHGRLKPSNILVVADKLKLSAECSPIASGKSAAIPSALEDPSLGAFDAPELGRGVLSPAADVWSLGMSIAAALTQRTPAWDRESGFEPVVRPALPAPFESIVRDCLRIDPASRITVAEITSRLEGNAPAQHTSAADHPDLEPDFDPDFNPEPAHSSRWAPAWIAAAVFLGIAVTAFVLHGRQSPSSAATADSQPAAAAGQQPADSSSSQAATAPPAVAEKPSAAAPESLPASRPSAVRAAAPGSAMNRNAAGNDAVLRRVLPDVLPSARASIRGAVLIPVRVQVDANGAVTDAVSEAPRASRYFNRIAIQAAQAWRFVPAPAAGGAMTRVWVLSFRFRGDGTTVTAGQRTP